MDREDMWKLDDKETCRVLTEQIEEEWLEKAEKQLPLLIYKSFYFSSRFVFNKIQ